MSWSKKYGNILGSWVIRCLTGCQLKDASSGFRAYTKECLHKFQLTSSHTYTHETIIQAVNKDMVIVEVPVKFKKRSSGKSKLISSVWAHIKKSASTIVRTILLYKSFKMLTLSGLIILTIGLILALRFLYFYFASSGEGHIQSLILSSILLNLGFLTIVMGLLADLISMNRKLLEKNK